MLSLWKDFLAVGAGVELFRAETGSGDSLESRPMVAEVRGPVDGTRCVVGQIQRCWRGGEAGEKCLGDWVSGMATPSV